MSNFSQDTYKRVIVLSKVRDLAKHCPHNFHRHRSSHFFLSILTRLWVYVVSLQMYLNLWCPSSDVNENDVTDVLSQQIDIITLTLFPYCDLTFEGKAFLLFLQISE